MSLPTRVRTLAEEFYRGQEARARSLSLVAGSAFRSLGPEDPLWEIWETEMRDRLASRISDTQEQSARAAYDYVNAQALTQGYMPMEEVRYEAFKSPWDDLRYWLGTGPAEAYRARMAGLPWGVARERGARVIEQQAHTLTADAGREASGVSLAITPGLDGYYRKLTTPSCDRCAILAGEYYSMEEAFKRHPSCDCVHVPVGEHDDSLAYDAKEAIREGKVGSWRTLPDGTRRFESSLSEAERDAILNEDADMYRIVNAKRHGMRTTDMFGGRVTPAQIYREAGRDKDKMRRLMRQHGFIR